MRLHICDFSVFDLTVGDFMRGVVIIRDAVRFISSTKLRLKLYDTAKMQGISPLSMGLQCKRIGPFLK